MLGSLPRRSGKCRGRLVFVVGRDFRYNPRPDGREASPWTAQTKGRIRHVALSVKDPWGDRRILQAGVGLAGSHGARRAHWPEGVFLNRRAWSTSPYLHFKSDEASQGTGLLTTSASITSASGSMDVVEQGQEIARQRRAPTWIMGDTNNPHGLRGEAHRPQRHPSSTSPRTAGVGSQMNPGSEDQRFVRPNPQRRLAKFDRTPPRAPPRRNDRGDTCERGRRGRPSDALDENAGAAGQSVSIGSDSVFAHSPMEASVERGCRRGRAGAAGTGRSWPRCRRPQIADRALVPSTRPWRANFRRRVGERD